MAKADIKMPEDFLLKISRLGSNMDSIAETVLEAGGEVVLELNTHRNPQVNWQGRWAFLR